ncbi:MAG: PQQ-binding-like beta-propeller repeat protein [Myxococcota bacterium]|nr:PQQ-binding-like beta-propeller repeat protein [Myxococcota bacterium]
MYLQTQHSALSRVAYGTCLILMMMSNASCGAGFGGPQDVTPLTGRSPGVEPIYAAPNWRFPLYVDLIEAKPHKEFASPGVDDTRSIVYYGGSSSDLFAVEAATGRARWQVPIQGGVRGAIQAHDGLVYVGNGNRELVALDADRGETKWKYRVQGVITKGVRISGERLIAVDGTNTVYALNRKTGEWVWQYRRDPPAHFAVFGEARPLVSGDKIFIGFSDGHLACLSATDGALLWLRNLAPNRPKFPDVDADPVMASDSLYAASIGGGVYALDPATGKERWSVPITNIVAMAQQGDHLLMAKGSGALMRYDTYKRKISWQTTFNPDAGSPGTPVEFGDFIIVGLSAGPLYWLDSRTGRPVQHLQTGSGFFGPPAVAADGGVFALSNGGVVYGYSAGKKKTRIQRMPTPLTGSRDRGPF